MHSYFSRLSDHVAYTITGMLVLLALSSPPSLAYDEFEVIAETTSCDGETGFSSFSSTRLHKISEGWCNDPNNNSKKLKQILIKSEIMPGNLDVIWVTASEAKNIMQQIKEGRTAKIKRIEGASLRIDVHNHGERQNNSSKQLRSNAAATEKSSDQQTLSIAMLDPMISNTRSKSKIITDATLKERTLVGKVEAPAGLLSVTVNGATAEIGEGGIFTTKVTLAKHKTPVEVVAIDKTGLRKALNFELEKPSHKLNKKNQVEGFGKYYALVIANTEYQHIDDLVTPANDAKVVADLLTTKFGFSTQILTNATRYQMMSALNTLRGTLTEQDNLMIYYAGHGAFDKTNNRGHWLPVDAEPNSSANWISTIAITDIINSMSAMHVLLVADSCYSGAITRDSSISLDAGMSQDARAKWLRAMANTRSRHLLTSGGVKPVLDDGGNGHSVFANAFIDALEQGSGIVEASRLYQDIKRKVETRAQQLNVEQSPVYAKLQTSEHEFGEFLLVSQP